MSGRQRGPLLRRIFRSMPLMLKRPPPPGYGAVLEIRVTEAPSGKPDIWQVGFADGRCTITAGPEQNANATTTFEPVAFLRFVAGLRSAPELYMSGKLKVEGDLMLAVRVPQRFEFPARS
jgi:hypothetical protein